MFGEREEEVRRKIAEEEGGISKVEEEWRMKKGEQAERRAAMRQCTAEEENRQIDE